MTYHWEALGWTLIHFCWQAAAIALVYKMADLALKKSRANVRYLLALMALLGMLVVSLATLAYEEASYHRSVPLALYKQQIAASGIQLVPQPLAVIDMPTAPRKTVRYFTNDLMPYLDAIWLAGVSCLLLRTIGGWWLIRRLRHSALQKAPHTLRIHLDGMRLKMRIPRFVDLRLSRRVASPLTVGVIRPLILLPMTALTGLSPEQLEVVLAHELAHIRRADYFWNITQTIVETLFFFHPAVWWISHRVREHRELCCDDIAVSTCQDPAVYASALLRLEEERKLHLPLAMALDGNQSRLSLRARILRILGDPEEQPRDFKPLSLAAMIAALVLFVCPLPQVFASFKQAPKVSATIVRAVQKVTLPSLKSAKPPVASLAQTPPATIAEPAPAPSAAPAASPSPSNESVAIIGPENAIFETGQNAGAESAARAKSDYIDQMKAAGYDVDLDKYVAMKVQGITPEYAQAMAKAGIGKPGADELIAMKVQGITPEYADSMAKVGFGKPSIDDLIAMKIQGVTPDYAQKLRSDGIEVSSFKDLISYRIFNVSPEFVAGMKAAGFSNIPPKKLLSLRVQGVTPEFAKSAKAQFPEATVDDLIQLRIFNIDGDFIASAKRHGFAPLTVQKLVKLRISGILDDDQQSKENQ